MVEQRCELYLCCSIELTKHAGGVQSEVPLFAKPQGVYGKQDEDRTILENLAVIDHLAVELDFEMFMCCYVMLWWLFTC